VTAVESRGGADKTDVFGAGLKWFITGTANKGKGTFQFRARKSPNRAALDTKNRALGLAGELAVAEHERRRLRTGGREDLACQVRHVAVVEGDGAGYDVMSFELEWNGEVP